jgi:hypothetical protein
MLPWIDVYACYQRPEHRPAGPWFMAWGDDRTGLDYTVWLGRKEFSISLWPERREAA